MLVVDVNSVVCGLDSNAEDIQSSISAVITMA